MTAYPIALDGRYFVLPCGLTPTATITFAVAFPETTSAVDASFTHQLVQTAFSEKDVEAGCDDQSCSNEFGGRWEVAEYKPTEHDRPEQLSVLQWSDNAGIGE